MVPNFKDEIYTHNDSITSNGLDISLTGDGTFIVDDLGIKCRLNFSGMDQED